MASLGSKSDGFGTAMHEMLHQMGAYDLYPSDGQQTSIWKELVIGISWLVEIGMTMGKHHLYQCHLH